MASRHLSLPAYQESLCKWHQRGFVEYEDGKSFTFHLSRTAMHGHDCACEVLGSEAKLLVNQVSVARIVWEEPLLMTSPEPPDEPS
jgi:hypothetical protein